LLLSESLLRQAVALSTNRTEGVSNVITRHLQSS
jgi:hypothetical protein